VTAAVVVPLTVDGGGSQDRVAAIHVGTQPTTSPCDSYLARPAGRRGLKRDIAGIVKQWGNHGRGVYSIRTTKLKHGVQQITICSGPRNGPGKALSSPPPSAPPAPRYRYSDDPADISARFADRLHKLVDDHGLTVVFTRPFAQETANLDPGHPSYFDGNVDVDTGGGHQGDIGVQVTHAVTTRVPFDGSCDPAHCVQTTLADGSVVRTDQVDAGAGTILTAEVHRPDGVVVEAQESDYGFGPDAPVRSFGAQPLPLDELTQIAEDPAFTF
jgi:hypothetical protein